MNDVLQDRTLYTTYTVNTPVSSTRDTELENYPAHNQLCHPASRLKFVHVKAWCEAVLGDRDVTQMQQFDSWDDVFIHTASIVKLFVVNLTIQGFLTVATNETMCYV